MEDDPLEAVHELDRAVPVRYGTELVGLGQFILNMTHNPSGDADLDAENIAIAIVSALDEAGNVIAELAEESADNDVSVETLRLWSVGKCIGGPAISLGPSTPETCKAIARYRETP